MYVLRLMKWTVDNELNDSWNNKINDNIKNDELQGLKIQDEVHGVCEIIGPTYMHRNLIDKNITIFPSIYFYHITWHNITDTEMHKKITLPNK